MRHRAQNPAGPRACQAFAVLHDAHERELRVRAARVPVESPRRRARRARPAGRARARALRAARTIRRGPHQRAALPARGAESCCETGDWLGAQLGGKPRLQKPPLFYWAGAAVAATHSATTRDRGALRARVGAAPRSAWRALVFAWGRALARAGLRAARARRCSPRCCSSCRRAGAATPRCCSPSLARAALFAFDRLDARRRRALLPVFAGLRGLAILTKATAVVFAVAATDPGVPVAAPRAARAARPGVLATCAAALAIGVSWYVAILIFVPGAFETLAPRAGPAHGRQGRARRLDPLPRAVVVPDGAARARRAREPRAAVRDLAAVAHARLPRRPAHALRGALLPGAVRGVLAAAAEAEALHAGDAARPRAVLRRRALRRRAGAPAAPRAVPARASARRSRWPGSPARRLFALFFRWVEGAPSPASPPGAAFRSLFLAGALAARAARAARELRRGSRRGSCSCSPTYAAVAPRVAAIPQDFALLSLDERERLVARSGATTPGSRGCS